MARTVLPADQYDEVVNDVRDRYGYDDMSDEEKEQFDGWLDANLERGEETDPSEDDDKSEGDNSESMDKEKSDTEKFRDEMREQVGYDDMSDEEKERFDTILDQELGQEGGDEEPVEPSMGAKVMRR